MVHPQARVHPDKPHNASQASGSKRYHQAVPRRSSGQRKGEQMAKPAILVVDDDAQVLRAIERDLRHKYGGDYRIVRATSADAALDALRHLKLRSEPVALLLSDQRMPL